MTTHMLRRSHVTLGRAITVAGASVAALFIWVVQGPLTGVDLIVRTGDGRTTVGPVAVVGVSLAVGLAGWAALAVLERNTARARRVWLVVAVAVLLLSFAGPLTSATSAAVVGPLLAMHAVVGTILIAGLSRRGGYQCSPAASRS